MHLNFKIIKIRLTKFPASQFQRLDMDNGAGPSVPSTTERSQVPGLRVLGTLLIPLIVLGHNARRPSYMPWIQFNWGRV